MQISIYKGDIMLRALLILLLSASSLSGFAQSNDESESRVTFYPLNIPYLFARRFHISIEFEINEQDNLLLGGHFNNTQMFESGKGGGFEVQYRVNFNRDSNVQFRNKGYWGPYLEYDILKSEYNYGSGNSYYSGDYQIGTLNTGMLFGSKYSIAKSIVLDLYFGVGLAINNSNSNYYTNRQYDSGYEQRVFTPYYKGGVQFGFDLKK